MSDAEKVPLATPKRKRPMKRLLLPLLLATGSCATSPGPLKDLPGYASLEACDTATIDFGAAMTTSGCFKVSQRAAGENGAAMPDGIVRLWPLIANSGGCDPSAGCPIPLSTSTPFMIKATQRWWTPLSGRLIYALWSDGYVATRMCLRRQDDLLVGDVGRVNIVDGSAVGGRGSIVLERVACSDSDIQ